MGVPRDVLLAVRAQAAHSIDLKPLGLRIERIQTVLGSRPQPAPVIDEKGEGSVVAQAGRIVFVVPKRLPLSRPWVEAMRSSAIRAEPELARTIFHNRNDVGVREPAANAAQRVRSILSGFPVDPVDDPFTARPDITLAVLICGGHVICCVAIVAAVWQTPIPAKRRPYGEPHNASAVRAHPQGAFMILE